MTRVLGEHGELPTGDSKRRAVEGMFDRLAPSYDRMNRVISLGQDKRWRRHTVEALVLPPKSLVLDLACGTGDFSKLVAARSPGAVTIAADLTHGMLRLARSSGVQDAVCADAMSLPFSDDAFDCVFIGYGLRNFPRLDRAVAEIERVTRPGGLLVSLDFFLPANPLMRQLYLGYLFLNGAFWGTVLHGRPRIYTYIPDSLRSFVSIDDFSSILRRSGYGKVDARGFIFGGIALHCAAKSLCEK